MAKAEKNDGLLPVKQQRKIALAEVEVKASGDLTKSARGPKRQYTEEELLQIVRDKAAELGRSPKKKEVPQCGMIKGRLGTWKRVLELAGLPPLNQALADDLRRRNAEMKKQRELQEKEACTQEVEQVVENEA